MFLRSSAGGFDFELEYLVPPAPIPNECLPRRQNGAFNPPKLILEYLARILVPCDPENSSPKIALSLWNDHGGWQGRHLTSYVQKSKIRKVPDDQVHTRLNIMAPLWFTEELAVMIVGTDKYTNSSVELR